ncbi:exodeoxyribonuclease VII small subunit [Cognataquiflexum rubidum]|uniref:exodeoxyribonuclease VII small subunit n=1 Tax=Cognataquiflexum rubidum TaxID=2922273 RepID=UPI001F12CDB9|nr:exodeoxyribonuclease VII small subunit [Cognataquiflexum rubidum]MCH6234356.1 exodeoxyribonuclease VII small subunit [Cognataquiflexum rubidum]
MENNAMSYDQAISRIEEIVSILESGEKGMDELSVLVKEAAALVKDCKRKLKSTESEISKALEDDEA